LRPYVGGRDAVQVEAASIGELLPRLAGEHIALRKNLFADDGRLRSFVNVYVNDRDIRQLSAQETPVRSGDTVSIIPSIAGGTGSTAATEVRAGMQHAAPLPSLSHEEILRYSRHLILPDVGLEGQKRLKAARVLLVGAGGLGSPAALYLAAAGVLLDKPNVYGSIFRFEGQASVFHAKRGPCYRCLYSEPPPPGLVPSCAEGGVLGVLPGIIGSIQAMETIKLILGAGQPLIGRLVLFDALKLQFRELKLEKDPDCPVCGAHPTVTELIDYQAFCGIGAEPAYDGAEITAEELRDEWQRNPELVVIDVREPHEHEIAHIDGAVLMPLGELPDRLGELDGHREIVTHCHHGARSLKALEILKAAGFSKVRSLRGGIDAWAVNVDPSLPRY